MAETNAVALTVQGALESIKKNPAFAAEASILEALDLSQPFFLPPHV